jgi:hypothetical protein
MKAFTAIGLMLVLSACGSRGELRLEEGKALPPAPYGARETPTPSQLLQPAPETRPSRDDNVLDGSEEREADPFDLPPPGAR